MIVEKGVKGRGAVAAAVKAAAVPPLHAVPARLVLDGEQLVHVGRVVQPQLHPDEGLPDRVGDETDDHDGVEKTQFVVSKILETLEFFLTDNKVLD